MTRSRMRSAMLMSEAVGWPSPSKCALARSIGPAQPDLKIMFEEIRNMLSYSLRNQTEEIKQTLLLGAPAALQNSAENAP